MKVSGYTDAQHVPPEHNANSQVVKVLTALSTGTNKGFDLGHRWEPLSTCKLGRNFTLFLLYFYFLAKPWHTL